MGKTSKSFANKVVLPGTNQIRKNVYHSLKHGHRGTLEFEKREILYWTGFFKFNDKKFEKIFEQVIYNLYYNGMVGVQKVNDEYYVYNVASYKQKLNGDISSAQCTLRVQGDSKSIMANSKMVAYTRSNMLNIGWYFNVDHYINTHEEILTSLSINRENTKNNVYIEVENGSKEMAKEIKALKMSESPVTILSGGSQSFIKQVHDISVENQVGEFWDDLWNNLKLMDKMRGMRRNLDEKGERNLKDELANTEYGFDFLEAEKVRSIEFLVNEINNNFQAGLTFETIVEVKQKESQESVKKEELENDKNKA